MTDLNQIRCLLNLRIGVGVIVCLTLVGCDGSNQTPIEAFQLVQTHTYNKPVSLKTTSSALVKAIVSTPAVSRALSSAAATKERVAITRSQKEMTVSANGSSGIENETNDGSEGVLIVGVTAQKVLNDNGKLIV